MNWYYHKLLANKIEKKTEISNNVPEVRGEIYNFPLDLWLKSSTKKTYILRHFGNMLVYI